MLLLICLSFISIGTQITPGQTIRVQTPGQQGTTILKAAPGTSIAGQSGQSKQIITVHKSGTQVSSQPQIVTLVKTTQGMAVASVSYNFQ